MVGMFTAFQVLAYTGTAAYSGFLVGQSKCPAMHHYYFGMCAPAAFDGLTGLLSGLRGNPYHGSLLARLIVESPGDSEMEIASIPEGAKGAVVGSAAGFSVSIVAYSAGLVAGYLLDKI